MKKTFFSTIFLLFLFPSLSFAVDFSIPDVKIDAYLQENGEVDVIEQHTYSFDGKFNGITREIFPKKGAEISDFLAKEGEKNLKVEKEGELYKIHRKGKDEIIQVDLHYSIKNGVEKYSDVAQFYWPFFDDRNEADYGQMTIAIHPPQLTGEAIALGYDFAFQTESVTDDGTVVFSLGEVEAGENGDIRAAYDSTLFPAMPLAADKRIKEEIINEKKTMEEHAFVFAQNKKKMSSTATWFLVGLAILFIGMAINQFKQVKKTKQAVMEDITQDRVKIPEQQMSMPATIHFTDTFHNETIAAALLDLVRQGYVKQTGEGQFILIDRNVSNEHEEILIGLLFDKIGWNGAFSMNDLEGFMKDKENHMKYSEEITRWKVAVGKETKNHSLYDKRKIVRTIAGLFSIIPLLFIVLSAKYELYIYMTLFILLFIAYLSFAVFYQTLSKIGIRMQGEWKRLGNEFDQLSDWDWKLYSENDRMRAMIYSLGVSGTLHIEPNKYAPVWEQVGEAGSVSTSGFYPMYWPFLATSFSAAGEQANETSASQSSSSSSGGGVGGGGGGSGAF